MWIHIHLFSLSLLFRQHNRMSWAHHTLAWQYLVRQSLQCKPEGRRDCSTPTRTADASSAGLMSFVARKQYTFLYTEVPPSVRKHSSVPQWTRIKRSYTNTVFSRSNIEIMGSYPTQGMDECLLYFCVCVSRGLATGWSGVQGVLPNSLGLRNWSETKRFADALCSKVRATVK
jgi:hypothetical protein